MYGCLYLRTIAWTLQTMQGHRNIHWRNSTTRVEYTIHERDEGASEIMECEVPGLSGPAPSSKHR